MEEFMERARKHLEDRLRREYPGEFTIKAFDRQPPQIRPDVAGMRLAVGGRVARFSVYWADKPSEVFEVWEVREGADGDLLVFRNPEASAES